MLFFFKSSIKSDKINSPITIVANSQQRAERIAIMSFKKWGYKGSPILAV